MNPKIWKQLTMVLAVVLMLVVVANRWNPAAAEPEGESGDPPTSSQGTEAQPLPERGAPLDETSQVSGAFTPRYYNVPGSVFVPVDSAVNVSYDQMGCIHLTAGAGYLLNAPLDIPPGSRIVSMRIYYDDKSSSNNLQSWITRYNLEGTDYNDLVYVNSLGASGKGTNYGTLDHVTDTFNYRYVLNAKFFSNSSDLQFCGMRVMYYPPITYGAFVPQLRSTAP